MASDAVQIQEEVRSVLAETGSSTDKLETAAVSKPHIVFFLVDDMGYNDIGYQSEDIPNATPFLDSLAADGVKLTRYYTEFECTPARAALMTGKLPIKLGLQHECITPTSPFGLKREEVTMADYLKEGGGYATHLVGKWDLGHYATELWPTKRGFDSFYGLACYGYEDYATHANKGFWDLQDISAAEGRHTPNAEDYGTYSTFLFGARAADIVTSHPSASTPLLLYVPFNAVHNTLSVPSGWNETAEAELVTYSSVTQASVVSSQRRTFAGALYLMDQQCKVVVEALKGRGMYANSVIVLASDNGGSPIDGGNNWPLRGAKKTMFEGGHRVPSFVHSKLLSVAAVGSSFHGLVHVTDWLPTLVLGAAQIKVTDASTADTSSSAFSSSAFSSALSSTRVAALDGFNLWDELNKAGGTSPRNEVLLNVDYVDQSSEDSSVESLSDVWMGLLLEVHGKLYKLMVNQFDYTYYAPSTNAPHGEAQQAFSDYIFEVSSDFREQHNLLEHMEKSEQAHDMPGVIDALTQRLCAHYESMVPAQYKGSDKQAKQVFSDLRNGWVAAWASYDDSVEDGLELASAPKCDASKLAAYLWAKRGATASGDASEDDEQFDDDERLAAQHSQGAPSPEEEADPLAALLSAKRGKLQRKIQKKAQEGSSAQTAPGAVQQQANAKQVSAKLRSSKHQLKNEALDSAAAAASLLKVAHAQ